VAHISELFGTQAFRVADENVARGIGALKNRALLGAAIVAVAGGLALGFWQTADSSGNAAAAAPPPTSVTITTVHPSSVRIWSDFSGKTKAVDAADIRPEVSGRITDIRFSDGQLVREGDVLFVIDPRPHEAAVAKAQADLASALANQRLAATELERARRLLATKFVSQALFDQRNNALGVAAASVKAAQAALTQAQLDVDHAYVKAPISGRVSRAEITVGNLVQAGGNAPLLTSIVSNKGIYADFEVDEQTYMHSIRGAGASAGQEQRIPVELAVQGETRLYRGAIESFDNKIDSGSGTIRARARFANEDGALMPGMFVTVKLANANDSTVMLVPEDSVGNDQSKRFVYVVGPGEKVQFREVALGQSVRGNRVVLSGLTAGDRVILDGLQRVAPGDAVAPRLANTASR
jgi:membrane fusion protein, multidrug efflux system